MNIRSRANRILGGMESFKKIDEPEGVLKHQFGSLPNDTIGIYVNDLKDAKYIVITESAVEIRSGISTNRILYHEIQSVDAPTKGASCEIMATLNDGKKVYIPVLNGHHQVQDVFEFTRFLMRSVRESVKSKMAIAQTK